MGEFHRAAGQEHGVDIAGGQSRLSKAVLDARRDAIGQLLGMADEIGAADGGAETGRDPFQRDIRPALLGQRDLGVFDFHRQRMAALFVDHAHQPVEQFGLAGLVPDLADIGDHARLVHAVDARPGREVVEIARRHVEPGTLHGAAEAEQRHDHAEAELTVEIGAADAHAVIGENIGCAIGLAVALGPETHDRKVGRAAADIGDQCDFLGRDLSLIVQRRGDRFELKRDLVKADPARD